MVRNYLLILFLFCFQALFSIETFRFALFTDLHIQVGNQQNSDDLLAAIKEVNSSTTIDFVLIASDITHNADSMSMQLAKSILVQMNKPYYITPGNHDLDIDRKGVALFTKVFGNDKFNFLLLIICYFQLSL